MFLASMLHLRYSERAGILKGLLEIIICLHLRGRLTGTPPRTQGIRAQLASAQQS